MLENDEIRLRHMLEAACEAVSFASERSRSDLDKDRLLTLSLVKTIEIVGEAASQVTSPTRQQLSNVPWERIVGMRNRLVHVYFDVNLDIVWETVQEDLPELITLLESSIPTKRD